MSTVIKATDRGRGIHGVAFNLDDMARGAEAYLAKIREHAGKIIADATREAEEIRQRAEAEGRQAGLQAGRLATQQMVDRQVGEKMQSLLPALQQAIGQIEKSRQDWLAHWEQRVVQLAAAMAARVARRELRHDPSISLALVRESLELAAGASDVSVLLNPADRDALGPQLDTLVKEFARLGPARIVSAPEITPGGCRVETRFGAIDQQVESQLARIEQELI